MTSAELREKKNELRKSCKLTRKGIDSQKKCKCDSEIVSGLANCLVFEWAKEVLMYYPCNAEVSVLELFDKCIALGKKVYFPKSLDNGIMEFYRVTSLDGLKQGRFGIPEPEISSELYEYSPEKQTLCIVPSLCLDRRGYRLGYGKGYYDRFAKSCPEVVLCAVQYDELVFDEIAFDKRHDRRVDMIVTQKGVSVLGQKEE